MAEELSPSHGSEVDGGGNSASNNVQEGQPAESSSRPIDRHPFWRNRVDSDNKFRDYPELPDGDLEIEDNLSRNEEVRNLIREIRSREWRESQEQSRLVKRYGINTGYMGRLRRFLGGECDFQIVTEDNGRTYAARNVRNEISRKATNIAWKTAKTGAIMAGVGLLTGGIGSIAVAGSALAGGALARGVVETTRSFSNETRQREELVLAREVFYRKVEELADRVGPCPHPDEANMSEDEIREYYRDRNRAIRDLLNFAYSSDQVGVDIKRDITGRAYFSGGPVGEPLPPEFGPDAPPPGGPSGPSIHTGTNVLQPSRLNVDAVTLDDMEKGFERTRERWERIEDIAAAAGGIVGGLTMFLRGQGFLQRIAETQFANGNVVSMDIDGNGVYHGVQKVTEEMAKNHGITSDFIWHHNSASELGRALAENNTVFQGFGEHGARLLNDNVLSTLVRQSALGSVLPVSAGILGRLGWRLATNANSHNRFQLERKDFKHNQEMWRRRLQPDAEIAKRKNDFERLATDNNKPFPEPGQEWLYKIVEGDGDESRDKWIRLKIVKFLEIDPLDPDNLFIEVVDFDKEKRGSDSRVRVMNIRDLLEGDSQRMERRENLDNPYDRTSIGPASSKETESVSEPTSEKTADKGEKTKSPEVEKPHSEKADSDEEKKTEVSSEFEKGAIWVAKFPDSEGFDIERNKVVAHSESANKDFRFWPSREIKYQVADDFDPKNADTNKVRIKVTDSRGRINHILIDFKDLRKIMRPEKKYETKDIRHKKKIKDTETEEVLSLDWWELINDFEDSKVEEIDSYSIDTEGDRNIDLKVGQRWRLQNSEKSDTVFVLQRIGVINHSEIVGEPKTYLPKTYLMIKLVGEVDGKVNNYDPKTRPLSEWAKFFESCKLER